MLSIQNSEWLRSEQDNHSVWGSAKVISSKTSPKGENSFLGKEKQQKKERKTKQIKKIKSTHQSLNSLTFFIIPFTA
jgi:hypothetical protein